MGVQVCMLSNELLRLKLRCEPSATSGLSIMLSAALKQLEPILLEQPHFRHRFAEAFAWLAHWCSEADYLSEAILPKEKDHLPTLLHACIAGKMAPSVASHLVQLSLQYSEIAGMPQFKHKPLIQKAIGAAVLSSRSLPCVMLRLDRRTPRDWICPSFPHGCKVDYAFVSCSVCVLCEGSSMVTDPHRSTVYAVRRHYCCAVN